ncbi:hypothetical protein V2H45_17175 [Tumidithrix elongata RA019]|uniref:Outer membrane protein beta-barrel domain-containing protein n=1 Tax=Tumidithrix elongata BACA0141 TaxID=2716417 RepID=A0AAW9PUG3_9CYAN|nr:hypothetical protein [Tumidithrix elongata RA019]
MNKNLFKLVSGLGILGCVTVLAAQPSQAQPAYGSYLGVGAGFGLSNGNTAFGEGSKTSLLLSGRYKFLEVPISLRTQVLIGNSTAVVPTVSFDVPLNFDADVYLGAGISLANTIDTTPVGNKNSFVLQPGIDYSVPNSNLVIFGNVLFAFDAYRNAPGTTATSLQTGLGWRF